MPGSRKSLRVWIWTKKDPINDNVFEIFQNEMYTVWHVKVCMTWNGWSIVKCRWVNWNANTKYIWFGTHSIFHQPISFLKHPHHSLTLSRFFLMYAACYDVASTNRKKAIEEIRRKTQSVTPTHFSRYHFKDQRGNSHTSCKTFYLKKKKDFIETTTNR